MKSCELVEEPIDEGLQTQRAFRAVAPRGDSAQLLREHHPDLPKQVAQAFEQQPIDRIAAGGAGLGLVLLTIAGFDAETSLVELLLPTGFLVDGVGFVAFHP